MEKFWSKGVGGRIQSYREISWTIVVSGGNCRIDIQTASPGESLERDVVVQLNRKLCSRYKPQLSTRIFGVLIEPRDRQLLCRSNGGEGRGKRRGEGEERNGRVVVITRMRCTERKHNIVSGLYSSVQH